ncbi:HD domain-containing protein [Candidatus Nitronereus thalassa]|uniref:HD domain-containing protein n=1 Tax=Candidatus Nitronereus thalassa TaxID=3020898 RepID=A0ABU3K640_9BACT|nr:HD domain-containing protein [Candidatus Nitronereus thalassa]MDT7041827.1 HD domain-containing protein [Candidatus Nitronereus thalassa]
MPHPPLNHISLIADPIHQYIQFTVPLEKTGSSETTEKDLIDSPWLQRLRYIYQLQSARWVYPSAEHSRFQHSLGAMHLAGRYAKHIYPTLAQIVRDVPSLPYIEELLRVTALVHDIGHGPFCHFFDHHFLKHYNLSHEQVGQSIIRHELGSIIKKLTRSPSGAFEHEEVLNPEHIAFLILKDPHKQSLRYPRWLQLLQPLIGGLFTADNFDYVLRDSYMCGIAVGPVDISRLIHYTLITPKGLTLHKNGLPALQMFLNARFYLYSNVYFHRTTRAIDLHLLEIFRETMECVFPHNPIESLKDYLRLTDWSLLETVRSWTRSTNRKRRRLAKEWGEILGRQVKWKTAYSQLLTTKDYHLQKSATTPAKLEARIRQQLPRSLKKLTFRVDIASKDTRPFNVLNMGQFQFYIYDPATQSVAKERLKELFEFLPSKIVQLRIFAKNHHADEALAKAIETVLRR